MHGLALATLAVAEHRLAQVPLGNVDVFALLEVADAAAIDRAAHSLADLRLVPAQEALAVADRLVLAGQPSIDDLLQHVMDAVGAVSAADPVRERESPADLRLRATFDQELFRTRRYHSHSSRTCLGV